MPPSFLAASDADLVGDFSATTLAAHGCRAAIPMSDRPAPVGEPKAKRGAARQITDRDNFDDEVRSPVAVTAVAAPVPTRRAVQTIGHDPVSREPRVAVRHARALCVEFPHVERGRVDWGIGEASGPEPFPTPTARPGVDLPCPVDIRWI